MVSTSESDAYLNRPQMPYGNNSFESDGSPGYRQRGHGDLMLPAPLSVAMPQRKFAGRDGSPASAVSRSQSQLDDESYNNTMGDSSSNHRLIPSPGDNSTSPDEREASSSEHTHARYSSSGMPAPQSGVNMAAMLGAQQGVRHGMVPTNQYPGETPNPYRNSLPQIAAPSMAHYDNGYSTGDEEGSSVVQTSRQARGVSLVDRGPVPSATEPRRVPRPSARRQSAKALPQTPSQYATSQYSASPSMQEESRSTRPQRPPQGPPPGAAAPAHQQRRNDPRFQ